ncbi:MAG TPA: hypothetical protein VGV64_07665, partial [Thermoplasmata archaeon]|nr:hypothetical protein [Thermoplasmata archaeon]
GGIVEGWPELVGIVEAAIRSDCQPPARAVEVRKAQLGPDLVALGAASLAWERLGPPPSGTLTGRVRGRGRPT